MIFYKHECVDNDLSRAGVYTAFITYDARTHETAFFNVVSRGESPEDGDIVPFTKHQVAVVERRYLDWCAAHPDKAVAAVGGAVVHFNREAYEDFMRSL